MVHSQPRSSPWAVGTNYMPRRPPALLSQPSARTPPNHRLRTLCLPCLRPSTGARALLGSHTRGLAFPPQHSTLPAVPHCPSALLCQPQACRPPTHRRSALCLQRLLPPARAQAPLVPRLEAREPGRRRHEVVPSALAKLQELLGDLKAEGKRVGFWKSEHRMRRMLPGPFLVAWPRADRILRRSAA